MSSTRNLNSRGNYCLEQHNRKVLNDRRFYFYGQQSRAFDPAYPELFYRQGYMPPDNFSYNPTDIESQLKGIGSRGEGAGGRIGAQGAQGAPSLSFS